MKNHLLSLVAMLILSLGHSAQAQEQLRIAIISDNAAEASSLDWFENKIKTEIQTLLQNRYDLEFSSFYGGYDEARLATFYEDAFNDPNIDMIVSMGTISSQVLSARTVYSKPAIGGIIISPEIQNTPKTSTGTSGVNNFTYIQSPFDINRDLDRLYEIQNFNHLAVLGGNSLQTAFPFIKELITRHLAPKGVTTSIYAYQGSAQATVDQFASETDAVYVLPIFRDVDSLDLAGLFSLINQKRLPSAALLGEEYINAGALMGYEASSNLQRIPRRIALNILKIVEGQNPADIPVEINTYTENLIVNMAAARATKIYPSFDLMADAKVINLNPVSAGRKLSLEGTIVEVLQQSLELKIAEADPAIAETEVRLAKAELLPQANVNTSVALIDAVSTNSSFGAQGRVNWLASGDLSQLVFSEPALANVAIQELLVKSSEAELKQVQLDVVLDAAAAYLTVLQAQSVVRIQQNNVEVTKDNYDIAKAKEAVGYSGVSDLYRWTSELAQKNIDLNDAQAQLRQSKFQLNQLLNRPLTEAFSVENISLDDSDLLITDERMVPADDYGELANLADFLVVEAKRQLPELQQLQYSLQAQNRLAKSQKRAFYLPSLAISGSANYLVDKWNVPEVSPELAAFGLGNSSNAPTWSLGLGLQFPLTQGGKRSANLQQTKLAVRQLENTQQNLANQLELRVRSNMELVGASFARTQLAKEAFDAGQQNFQLVQDSYSQGVVNITTLIDAQNAALQAEISAVNAEYTLILDFMSLERSVGAYYSLSTASEQAAYFERMAAFMTSKK